MIDCSINISLFFYRFQPGWWHEYGLTERKERPSVVTWWGIYFPWLHRANVSQTTVWTTRLEDIQFLYNVQWDYIIVPELQKVFKWTSLFKNFPEDECELWLSNWKAYKLHDSKLASDSWFHYRFSTILLKPFSILAYPQLFCNSALYSLFHISPL